jgi:hypothetical protein
MGASLGDFEPLDRVSSSELFLATASLQERSDAICHVGEYTRAVPQPGQVEHHGPGRRGEITASRDAGESVYQHLESEAGFLQMPGSDWVSPSYG